MDSMRQNTKMLMRKRRALPIAAIALVALGAFAAGAAVSFASPATGVTPTVLARGTFDSFKVKSDPGSPVDLKVKAKAPMDVVVRRHDYGIGANTGWHQHPGPDLRHGHPRAAHVLRVRRSHLCSTRRDGRPRVRRHRRRPHCAERVGSARAGRECHLRTRRWRLPHRTGRSWTVLQFLTAVTGRRPLPRSHRQWAPSVCSRLDSGAFVCAAGGVLSECRASTRAWRFGAAAPLCRRGGELRWRPSLRGRVPHAARTARAGRPRQLHRRRGVRRRGRSTLRPFR